MDKDGTSTIPNDPVAGLIDIPLPQAISLWPATWTSRIAIVLLIVGLIATIVWFMRRWHANRYRRAALAELDGIVHSPKVDREPELAIDNLALHLQPQFLSRRWHIDGLHRNQPDPFALLVGVALTDHPC